MLEGGLASPGLVSGTFFLHPRGCFIWEQIQSFINKEFSELKVQNVLFPSLIPYSGFVAEQKSQDTLDLSEIIRLHSDKDDLSSVIALRPTSELLFTHFFKERIQERKTKLPILLNQWSSVYRAEKNTKLFFRSKEFYWQELHSIHISEDEAKEYLLLIDEIYKKLLKKLLCISYLGGEKTKLERFPGAEQTLTNECILPDGQVLQLTTSHYLSSFFASLLDIKYWVNNTTTLVPVQLSAGCSTRLIGSIVQMHSDESGLVLPWELAQEQIVVVVFSDLYGADNYLSILKQELSGYRFTIETTSSLGKTMFRLEKLGIPLVIIVGKQEIEQSEVTLKSRVFKDQFSCKLSDLKREVHGYKKRQNKELLNRSSEHNSNFVVKTRDWQELVKLISSGKVVLAPWRDEIENETRFKEQKYNFSIRCIKERLPLNTNFRCVFSGQVADCLVYFGRSY